MVRFAFIAVALCASCTEKTVTTSSTVTPTNEPPTATINSPFPREQIADGAFFVAWGSVSDAEDPTDALTVTWLISGEERCGPSPPTESDGKTRCDVSFSRDKQNITLRVVDTQGETTEQTVDIELVDNTAPTVTITHPLPGQEFQSTELIQFEGIVSDGEDNPEGLTVWWESNVDGRLNDVGLTVMSDGKVTANGLLSANTHVLRLFALDGSGRENNASVAFDVLPVESADTGESNAPTEGDTGTPSTSTEGDTGASSTSTDDTTD